MEVPRKGPLAFCPPRDGLTGVLPQSAAKTVDTPPKPFSEDVVSLTASGRDSSMAVQRAQSVPDSREDRIMQLKRQLASGTYRIQGARVAGNMLRETLENNHVLEQIDVKP